MDFCKLCGVDKTDPGHDVSPKHTINATLQIYYKNRKTMSGNRKGVIVTCTSTSAFRTVEDSTVHKIKVSAKPNETVEFKFNIRNDTNTESMLVVGVVLAHEKRGFSVNDHGMILGTAPYCLKPKQKVPEEIKISYRNDLIGQYENIILFYFHRQLTNESLIIVRDMVVYVETEPASHDVIECPFTDKPIYADKVVPCATFVRRNPELKIPKDKKQWFAGDLKINDKMLDADKEAIAKLNKLFEDGVQEEIYVPFFRNLLWFEETVVRINLKKYNMEEVQLKKVEVENNIGEVPLLKVESANKKKKVPLRKVGATYELHVPGLAEKRPSVLPGDTVLVKPHNDETNMFEAVIDSTDHNTAYIKGFAPEFENVFKQPNAKFDIRFILSRIPYVRMHTAVAAVFERMQKPRVFPRKNTAVKPLVHIFNDTLFNPLIGSNPEQLLAVRHMVSGTSGTAPYILHGPPGTGKTVTIVEAILQLVKRDPTNKIMVCTDSNMAADNVACMIADFEKQFDIKDKSFLLRANSRYRVWESMPKKLRGYSNGISLRSYKPVKNSTMDGYRIVVTTLSHAAQFQRGSNACQITHLFIDEAAQASEPACLIPITGLLRHDGVLVLAGDHRQLGPVCVAKGAMRRGLGISLMERLRRDCPLYTDTASDPTYGIMLRNNFRSHKDILSLPNELFYGGNLRAFAREDKLSFVDILGERKECRPVVFHGVSSQEQRMGKSPSFYNNFELVHVQMYIQALIGTHQVRPEDIGVITPYIRQVYKVKKWLNTLKEVNNGIEVGTVESFQGKEKRVILISTVRANVKLLDHDARFQLGFLVDDKRFNVALTRAKAKVIVIGNPLCLSKDLKWRRYMELCRQYGTYLGFDPLLENNKIDEEDMVKRLKGLEVKDAEKVV